MGRYPTRPWEAAWEVDRLANAQGPQACLWRPARLTICNLGVFDPQDIETRRAHLMMKAAMDGTSPTLRPA